MFGRLTAGVEVPVEAGDVVGFLEWGSFGGTWLVRATAARDSQIAALWRDINNERLTRSRTSARRLAAKAALRTSVPEAAHTLWALTVPELYILNVTESGRRPDAYQRWLADVLIAALLAP